MNWIVMPVVNGVEQTIDAIRDCLNQTGVEARVLVVNQGASDEIRQALEGWAQDEPRLLIWHHDPPLPSLSATWNRALDFVWEVGGDSALVANNDIRLDPWTYRALSVSLTHHDALLVSAVGVRPTEFATRSPMDDTLEYYEALWAQGRGGPDFSCFLLSREGHQKYRFDESFVPAFCEDLDAHRRYMLGGDGARIYSVNIPYLHYASSTLKNYTEAEMAAFQQRVGQSRGYYARKWGGAVNEETFCTPFGWLTGVPLCNVTTPELQRRVQAGEPALPEGVITV